MARTLIPNSTQVPDVILDHWMAVLTGAEFKVLLYIARRTYGFGKESDDISLNQIARGIRRRDGTTLDRGTGLARSGVKAACNSLIGKGLVIRTANMRPGGAESEASTYRLNLYAALPERVGQEKAHVGRRTAHPGQAGNRGGPETDAEVGHKLAPQETAQETVQETAAGAPRGGHGLADRAADAGLLQELVGHGVGRAVAEELAREKPEACRRYLEYLPYAEVRSTPGAWLASAIRAEYGPPKGYPGRRERARATGTRAGGRASRPDGQAETARAARAAYARLEKSVPEAIAAFSEFLARSRDRTARFAGHLERHREALLPALDGEEFRLSLFERWLREDGASYAHLAHPATEGHAGNGPPPGGEGG